MNRKVDVGEARNKSWEKGRWTDMLMMVRRWHLQRKVVVSQYFTKRYMYSRRDNS